MRGLIGKWVRILPTTWAINFGHAGELGIVRSVMVFPDGEPLLDLTIPKNNNHFCLVYNRSVIEVET